MENWASSILNAFEEDIDKKNYRGFLICTVININPLIFSYNDVALGESLGDKVYVHPLFVSSLINQDEESLLNIQNFKNSTAYNSPEFQATVEGSIPDFLKEFYLFYKNWQQTYLLSIGDLIAVYELEEGYLILQKVISYKASDYTQNNEGEENNEF